jgi:hypothetical protein
MVGDLADPAAEERGGLAWGGTEGGAKPRRPWIGGVLLSRVDRWHGNDSFFSRLSFSATVRWNKELLAGFSLGLAGLEG